MILLPPTSDPDRLSARVVRKVVPYRNSSPTRPLVDSLPALVEGSDLAIPRLLGLARACDGGPDAFVAAPHSGFGKIADSPCTAIARERGAA